MGPFGYWKYQAEQFVKYITALKLIQNNIKYKTKKETSPKRDS